jgi:hypothetical protein
MSGIASVGSSVPPATSLSYRPQVGDTASDQSSSIPDSEDLPAGYSTQSLVQRNTNTDAMPHANGFFQVEKELPRLQANGHIAAGDNLEPILEDDPASFDLVGPAPARAAQGDEFSLDNQTQLLFSRGHLQMIFADPSALFKFTTYLGVHRPQSVPILVHYLDSLKSLRAIHYANAICEGLDPVEGFAFTQTPLKPTINTALEERARAAFDILATEELPAYITHQYIQIVSSTITARVTGSLAPGLRESSDGLAEVFCLTDPSRPDNPIVFASEGKFGGIQSHGLSLTLCRVQSNDTVWHELCHWPKLSLFTGPGNKSAQHKKDSRSCQSWKTASGNFLELVGRSHSCFVALTDM